MTQTSSIVSNLEALRIPSSLKKDLARFCALIAADLDEKIISITVVGSAVTADFSSVTSDVNILVVLSQLVLKDLEIVAPYAHRWWRRERFSPRFISKRNLESSLAYFPIDFWAMQKNHIVVYGEDVLGSISIQKKDLLWQLRHEAKGLRMRIKQQFWRTAKDTRFARANLIADLTTIGYLLRVLFHIKDMPAPENMEALIGFARSELKISTTAAETIFKIKQGIIKPGKKDILGLYDGLMEYVRAIDEKSGEIVL